MLRHPSRLLVAAAALAMPAALMSTAAAATGIRPQAGPPRLVTAVRANVPAPAGVRARSVGSLPVRVASPSAYAGQKAAANAAASRLNPRASASAPTRTPLAPSLVRNWAGQLDTTDAPSDSTGTIGTTRYTELVNSKAAIYSRTSNTPTASGPLLSLTGCATSACTDSVFDVQIIWEPEPVLLHDDEYRLQGLPAETSWISASAPLPLRPCRRRVGAAITLASGPLFRIIPSSATPRISC